MCKTFPEKEQATTEFFDDLRGVAYDKPSAIYLRDLLNEGEDLLIGFSAIVDGVRNFFRVMEDNSVRVADMVEHSTMGLNGVAAYFGGDYAVAL